MRNISIFNCQVNMNCKTRKQPFLIVVDKEKNGSG